jgi:cytochrome c-type biogenesis protein
MRSVAPYTVRLRQAFGIIVIAFALSAFLQYDAIALGWLAQFFPEGRIGL